MEDSKQIALNVLRGAFIDRDPSVVGRYFAPGYPQHNPTLPDGPGPIIELPMWRSCRADGMSAISSNERRRSQSRFKYRHTIRNFDLPNNCRGRRQCLGSSQQPRSS